MYLIGFTLHYPDKQDLCLVMRLAMNGSCADNAGYRPIRGTLCLVLHGIVCRFSLHLGKYPDGMQSKPDDKSLSDY
jgi:hypothetical protein